MYNSAKYSYFFFNQSFEFPTSPAIGNKYMYRLTYITQEKKKLSFCERVLKTLL